MNRSCKLSIQDALIVYINRNTSTHAYLYNYLFSQECGISTMHKMMHIHSTHQPLYYVHLASTMLDPFLPSELP